MKATALLAFLGIGLCFRITVNQGDTMSFHEILKKGQKMGVNFQVEEGGNYDIGLRVQPNQVII